MFTNATPAALVITCDGDPLHVLPVGISTLAPSKGSPNPSTAKTATPSKQCGSVAASAGEWLPVARPVATSATARAARQRLLLFGARAEAARPSTRAACPSGRAGLDDVRILVLCARRPTTRLLSNEKSPAGRRVAAIVGALRSAHVGTRSM